MEILGSAYRRTPNAPWQRTPFQHGEEVYAMAGMARALTLVLCCTPRGRTEDVEALAVTCTRWQFALALGVERLLGE